MASYDPVHAEWYEDPEAIPPREYLTLAASAEEIQKAYRKFGARFEVSAEGELTLRLKIGPDPGPGQGSNGMAIGTHTTTLCAPAAATSRARLA